MTGKIVVAVATLLLVGCGGGGGGDPAPPPPPPPEEPPPPPPPPPPPDPPPDDPPSDPGDSQTEYVDGAWEIFSEELPLPFREEGGLQVLMLDRMVIVSEARRSAPHAMAYGMYHLDDHGIHAQLTRKRDTFPFDEFTAVLEDDGDLVVTLPEASEPFELAGRGRENGDLEGNYTELHVGRFSMTVYADGTFTHQHENGCTAAGNIGYPYDGARVFSLDFVMQSCPVAVRNGNYRGLGWMMSTVDWISVMASNDTNPDQFANWFAERL